MERAGRDTRPWGQIIFFASAGAAALHFAASGPHLMEYRPAGSFMIVSGIAQLVTGFWIVRGAASWLSDTALTLNAGLIGVWAWSRAFGLPVGPRPGMREDIHSQDALAVALEIVIVAALFARARGMRVDAALGRMLTKACAFGAILSIVVAAHDPAREQLVALATLALTASIHLCMADESITRAVRSFGRNHEEAARDRRIAVPVRLAAGTRSGQR